MDDNDLFDLHNSKQFDTDRGTDLEDNLISKPKSKKGKKKKKKSTRSK